MNRSTKALLVGGVALVASGAGWHYRPNARLARWERRRLELRESLADLTTHRDQERLYWYYAFREVEVPDAEVWKMAVKKMDDLTTAISNDLSRVESKLAAPAPPRWFSSKPRL